MYFILSAVIASIGLFVGYTHRAQYYWRRRGLPGPIGWPLLGNFYDVSDANFPRCYVLNSWTKMFGKVFGYMEGSVPTLVISDVAMSEGVVEESARAMMVELDRADKDEGLNIHLFFQEFTYDVICRLSVGQTEPSLFRNEGVSIVKGILLRSHRVLPWYLAVAFPNWQVYIKKLFYNHPNVRGDDIGKLFAFCHGAVEARIAKKAENLRKGIEHPVNDYIDEFLEYHVEKIDEECTEKQATTLDIVGACFVFLLAGLDTTANTLGYAVYLLAKNPKKMEIAQEEIDEFVGENEVTYNETRNLGYVEAAIKEALRLYPVGYFACSRTCTKTTTLGGIRVEKGTQVEVDMIAVHKDKELWGENVNDFEPERQVLTILFTF
ncbi:hypothetical protein CAEBREN_10122 [Caenorhabditis brenneri]|uniref:Uncharacterized protein n=1 Tax=Caenorhabditis brenneri TaxID=135651 RepID=G0MAM9_CAEBE|nr:hypothetical protein CAEBREN_10122 [Caenorhabditis brenneri]